ncbi:hypothetical protein WCWAEYFT_CDS0099 [Vibrio phage VB_VaC_TDDLMA]
MFTIIAIYLVCLVFGFFIYLDQPHSQSLYNGSLPYQMYWEDYYKKRRQRLTGIFVICIINSLFLSINFV